MGGCQSNASANAFGGGKMPKELVILVIGLDNSGKTTLTYTLKGDLEAETVPTVGFSAPSRLTHQQKQLCFYDLGGGARIRGVWKNYFHEVHGVIYMVDSADSFRFEESREELFNAIRHPMVVGKPILVLANKQDDRSAVDEPSLVSALGLSQLTLSRHMVVKCVAKPSKFDGRIDPRIYEGLDWLVRAITSDLHNLQHRLQSDTAKFKEQERTRKAEVAKRLALMKQDSNADNKNSSGTSTVTSNVQNQSSGAAEKSSTTPATSSAVPCSVKGCSRDAARRCQAAGWQAVCEECATAYEAGRDPAREYAMLNNDSNKVSKTNTDTADNESHTSTEQDVVQDSNVSTTTQTTSTEQDVVHDLNVSTTTQTTSTEQDVVQDLNVSTTTQTITDSVNASNDNIIAGSDTLLDTETNVKMVEEHAILEQDRTDENTTHDMNQSSSRDNQTPHHVNEEDTVEQTTKTNTEQDTAVNDTACNDECMLPSQPSEDSSTDPYPQLDALKENVNNFHDSANSQAETIHTNGTLDTVTDNIQTSVRTADTLGTTSKNAHTSMQTTDTLDTVTDNIHASMQTADTLNTMTDNVQTSMENESHVNFSTMRPSIETDENRNSDKAMDIATSNKSPPTSFDSTDIVQVAIRDASSSSATEVSLNSPIANTTQVQNSVPQTLVSDEMATEQSIVNDKISSMQSNIDTITSSIDQYDSLVQDSNTTNVETRSTEEQSFNETNQSGNNTNDETTEVTPIPQISSPAHMDDKMDQRAIPLYSEPEEGFKDTQSTQKMELPGYIESPVKMRS